MNLLQGKKVFHDVTIVHTVPDKWERKFEQNQASLKVGMTVWETDKLPLDWIPWMEKADKIVVPCEWNKKVLEDSGITKPVGVIPHIYREVPPEKFEIYGLEKSPFIFYTVGQWTSRKGIDDTIRAYLKAFTSEDNTILIVKTFKDNYSKDDQSTIISNVNGIAAEYDNPAKINVIASQLKDSQISYLHDIGHCYVSLCKSEGFGLGMFEAAGKGKPVVATGYGGHLDFLQGPFVDYTMGPVNMKYRWYTDDQNWAYPNIDHCSKILREVYENYETYRLVAEENSLKIKTEFNSEIVTQKLLNFIK